MESLDSKKYMLLQKGGKHEVNKVIKGVFKKQAKDPPSVSPK